MRTVYPYNGIKLNRRAPWATRRHSRTRPQPRGETAETNGPTMTEPCRWFASGSCRNGAACRFSHDATPTGTTTTTTTTVCRFFLSGQCSYGDKCRFEHPGTTTGGGGGAMRGGMRASASAFNPGGVGGVGGGFGGSGSGVGAPAGGNPWASGPPRGLAGQGGGYDYDYAEEDEDWGYVDESGNWVSFDDEGEGAREFLAAQLPDEDELLGLTSEGPTGDNSWGYFDEAGNWISLEGEAGDFLQSQEEERGVHVEEINGEGDFVEPVENAAEDEWFAASSTVECAVCLEVVMAKPRLADRRFGLLNACDHIFCLNCIRGWREGGTQRGVEASAASNEQARQCPICRVVSHFITPSTLWPRNEEEKTKMIDAYRDRLSKIPCRHFDGGDGACPFGSSCFYEHRYRATGELEETDVRKSTASDGSLNILTKVRLSDFLQGSRRLR